MTAASALRAVPGEIVDDRVAAGLLLPVAAEPDVHRQLPGGGQLASGREQHEQLALVVDGSAAVEVLAADLGLERVALPQVERRRRLDVEMAVAAGRSAPLLPPEAASSPIASGWPSQSTSSALPPALSMKPVTHSAARTTSAACAESALTEGIRRNSASSSNQAVDIERRSVVPPVAPSTRYSPGGQ